MSTVAYAEKAVIMKRSLRIKPTAVFVTIICAYVVLMFVCTFEDLDIALAIYNPDSVFGRLFEILGTFPMPIVGIFSCVSVTMTSKAPKPGTVIGGAVSTLLLAFFIFYGWRTFQNIIPGSENYLLALMIAWAVGSAFIALKIRKKGKCDELRRAAIIGLCGTAGAVFAPMIIKEIMSRPRFSTLSEPRAQFTAWYLRQPHTSISSNSSFPSGHSAQTALTLTTLLVPSFVPRLDTKLYRRLVLAISVAFTLCVMLSRMILGAHYATDVLTGAMITIAVMFGVKKLITK